ncbi:MAG: putative transport system ATP-binding protein [Verrucomicrobiaceae bacterium]|nr:putative transport system ATP-binding protein [Verrucomicrobiaceae bacterium]
MSLPRAPHHGIGEPIISLRDIRKSYQMGDITSHVLQGLSLDIYPGEYVCIMGPSGCGKSTLLNLLGCLDQPTTGDYILGGQNVAHLDDDTLSAERCRKLGFIFQSYNLIQQLSVVENIEVPMYYRGMKDSDMRVIAVRLATQVGLSHRLYHRPTELSGGQQQRVAIARALANDPLVILADEATGNLDSKSGQEILEAFDELNRQGKTLVFVTHDERMVQRCTRVIRLRDGYLDKDEPGAAAERRKTERAERELQTA